MHVVLASRTFEKQFRKLTRTEQERLRKAWRVLADDPLTPRSGADIRQLAGTEPAKHRIRIGDWRIIYLVDGSQVKMIELFRRGRGYRE